MRVTLKNYIHFSLFVLIIIFATKIARLDFSTITLDFQFNDLLSMILAFFAIALSVAFYFKATETSNRFYDNSYAFTKEMSEILGRMEAGFGERLRHLDEGYSSIREKFDRWPNGSDKTSEDIEKENAAIKSREKELKDTIEVLAEKAHLDASEKESLFKNITRISQELEDAKREVRRLSRSQPTNNSRHVLGYLAKRLQRECNVNGLTSSDAEYQEAFSSLLDNLPRAAVNDLRRQGLINENNELVGMAIKRMRYISSYLN